MNSLITELIHIVEKASKAILAIYQTEFKTQTKSDATLLTEADLIAHEIITQGLNVLTPNLPVLSEESAIISFAERYQWQRYWLVDPLDGTKEFVEKTGEFSINIALIEQCQPILGLIYIPVSKICYYAQQGQGAFKQLHNHVAYPIKVKTQWQQPLNILVSRRHNLAKIDSFLQKIQDYTVIRQGSAIKFGLIAEGTADIYPRLGNTSEWDTAAGQCIVEAAGGVVLDLTGRSLRYNIKESLLNPSFVVAGNISQSWFKYFVE